MPKISGSQVAIGFALETSRGTPESINYWMPRKDLAFFDKADSVDIEESKGSRLKSSGSYLKNKRADGTVGGNLYPIAIGFLLKSLLGKVTSNTTGAATTHVFELLENNITQSLSVGLNSPLGAYVHPLTMIESMEISASVGEFVTCTVNLKGKKGEGATHTVSFTSEKPFLSSDMKVFLAGNLAGLDAADNICLQSLTLTMTNTLEDEVCLSLDSPKDYLNNGFNIEGAIEMYFDSEVQKNKALNGDNESMRIAIIDEDVDIGGSIHPELTLDLANVTYRDWSPAFAIDGIIKQSVNFKAHKHETDNAIAAKLVNTKTSY